MIFKAASLLPISENNFKVYLEAQIIKANNQDLIK
jgi:hypothetical protein